MRVNSNASSKLPYTRDQNNVWTFPFCRNALYVIEQYNIIEIMSGLFPFCGNGNAYVGILLMLTLPSVVYGLVTLTVTVT